MVGGVVGRGGVGSGGGVGGSGSEEEAVQGAADRASEALAALAEAVVLAAAATGIEARCRESS